MTGNPTDIPLFTPSYDDKKFTCLKTLELIRLCSKYWPAKFLNIQYIFCESYRCKILRDEPESRMM